MREYPPIPDFRSTAEINAYHDLIRPLRETAERRLERAVAEYKREPGSQARVAIIGSFRFKPQMDEVIGLLEGEGIEVTAPPKGDVVRTDQNSNFPLIAGDDQKHPLEVEDEFMLGVARADVIYLVNPGGYFGLLSSVEWGKIHAMGKPVISMEQLDLPEEEGEPTYEILRLTTPIMTVGQLIGAIKNKNKEL